ncbi:MAG: GNAT family N-acetyltransferase [Halobacteriota archaeon]|nr:GNAT family N-acetyltransferase [Halobacteriota archaeon]
MIKVELFEEGEEYEYSCFLEDCKYSMAQHTLEWRDVVYEMLKDEPYYFVAKRDGEIVGVLPSFIKENSLGNVINSIPFAGCYGGVLTKLENDSDRKEVYKALLDVIVRYAEEKECILISISTPPFSEDFDLYEKIFEPEYVMPNFIQYIDLKNSKNYHRNIRRKVKKAIDVGVEITDIESSENLDAFYKIYKKRMVEVGGIISPPNFFKIVKEKAGENSKFIFASYEGKIVSGMLLLYNNNIIDDFYSTMDVEYNFTEANSLLTHYAIDWSKEKGIKFWNWQSLPEKESGAYKFKARWGSSEGKHYYMTKILGDLTDLRRCSIERLKKEFQWYFVMPYSELESDGG